MKFDTLVFYRRCNYQRSDAQNGLHIKHIMIALMYFYSHADEYNVFDAMIYPQAKEEDPAKSKGFFAGAFGVFSSRLLGRNNNSETDAKEPVQIPISNLKQMRSMCLQIYLHDDLNLIRIGGIAERGIDILGLFIRITTVHYNLCYSYLQDGRKNSSQVYNWSSQHLLHASNKRLHVNVSYIFFIV